MEWLKTHSSAAQSWSAALALAGGAPLLALQLDAEGLSALDADMRQSIAELAAGSVDITLARGALGAIQSGRAYHLA